jgi:hypothetical protein
MSHGHPVYQPKLKIIPQSRYLTVFRSTGPIFIKSLAAFRIGLIHGVSRQNCSAEGIPPYEQGSFLAAKICALTINAVDTSAVTEHFSESHSNSSRLLMLHLNRRRIVRACVIFEPINSSGALTATSRLIR